ncbi:MAG TPA: protein kinase [Gemmatimonadales bacterium]|nr:protein kinase [Gemmatimonadales bacterium]
MPSRAAPPIPDALRRAFAGQYQLERELGRGGMGAVYLAQDLKHERAVALKVLPPDLRVGTAPERFLREIGIAARLTHPQIVPLHDSGERNGLLYYVMPYLEGESLRHRIDREGPLPLDAAVSIARAVALALDYAHRRGVLHRDIKPENILLHEGGALVADFGVARAMTAVVSDQVSEPGIAIGTPAYMSPEQASAERHLDGRTDVYALGCVLYEMVAGRPPFAGTGARATMARHVMEPPLPLRGLRADVPESLDNAVARALAKDPSERFPTAGDFARALDAVRESAATTAPVAALAPRDRRAIAVLPFVNASAEPDTEYFADGMTDELIDALTQVEGLHVASRTTVFALKGRALDVRTLGAMLNVAVVLEGSVRRAGGRFRVTARLTEVASGRHLWSRRFDRDVADVFAVQDEIAASIVAALRAALFEDLGTPVSRRYTDNVAAYNLYLKGRYAWNLRTREGTAEGIRYFEDAIAEDPDYALAYTGLADCYALQLDYRGVPVAEGLLKAEEMALRALALDDRLAEAHTSLGWVQFIYEWDWDAARRSFERAIELDPRYATAHQWYAWLLIALGCGDDALAEGRAAAELDPGSVSIRRGLGWLYYQTRRYDAAEEHLRRALGMNPTQEETHRVLGLVRLQQGRYAEAEAELCEAMAGATVPDYAAGALGYTAARAGRPAEARDRLASLTAEARDRYVSPVAFVLLNTALGRADDAFAWLERAREERRGWLCYLTTEPLLDPLRDDPRFAHLIRAMRLP